MNPMFLEYTNYPLLRCGLAFFSLTVVCFLLFYHERHRHLWKWISIFAFLQGLNEIIRLVEMTLKSPGIFIVIYAILWLVSFLVFLEVLFPRSKNAFHHFSRKRNFVLFSFLAGLGALIDGWNGVSGVFSYALAFFIVVWVAWGVPVIVKESEDPGHKGLLWTSMAFIGAYAVSLVVVPAADFFPANRLNEGVFLMVFGFPVQLLRSLFVIVATVTLWFYHDRIFKLKFSEEVRSSLLRWQRLFLVALALVLCIGLALVSWVGNQAKTEERNDLLDVARVVTAGVNPRWVVELKATHEDNKNPEYHRLREQQISFSRAALTRGDIRWFYQMVMRDGKVVFTADSIPLEDKNHSEPGDIYTDAPSELYDVFKDGQERLVGPYEDQWGAFVSAFVPIRSVQTGAVVGVQGVDVDVAVFALKSLEAQIFAICFLMLIVVLMSGLFLWQVRTREAADALKVAFDELRRVNLLRQDAELQMVDLVEAMPNPVYFKDENLIYQSCNHAFAEYLGLPKEKIIGYSVHDVAPKELADQYHQADLDVIARGGRQQYDGQVHNADGTEHAVVFYKSVLYYSNGKPRGIVGIILDISDRKKMEQDLRENQDRLVVALEDLKKINSELKKTQDQLVQSEKLAAIGVLAAGVAHEINNPLGFIHGNIGVLSQYVQAFLDILAEYGKLKMAVDDGDMDKLKMLQLSIRELEERSRLWAFKEDVPSLFKETEDGVTRIKKIVSLLQNLSHPSYDQKKRLNVNDVLEGILSIVWNEVKYKADIVKEYGEALFVDADEQSLGQVFINIIVNAAHAVEGRGEIRLKTFVQGDHVVVAISDTGCGISKEVIPKVFDPFFTTKDPGKGTGLGLSISYDIIKKHNGQILVESAVGKGTTFRVLLPLAKKV